MGFLCMALGHGIIAALNNAFLPFCTNEDLARKGGR